MSGGGGGRPGRLGRKDLRGGMYPGLGVWASREWRCGDVGCWDSWCGNPAWLDAGCMDDMVPWFSNPGWYAEGDGSRFQPTSGDGAIIQGSRAQAATAQGRVNTCQGDKMALGRKTTDHF